VSATEQNSSKTTLNPAVETLETLEAIDMAGSFLLEATAHLLMRHYMKQEGEDYQRLSSAVAKCLVLARVSIVAALSVEEDRDDN
jgi:hypothetical protein